MQFFIVLIAVLVFFDVLESVVILVVLKSTELVPAVLLLVALAMELLEQH